MFEQLRARPIIGVCGAGECDEEVSALARETGRLLALSGAVVVTGGLGGVMEAASQGAAEAGGLVIGLLPSSDPKTANSHVHLALATGLGEMRNALIIRVSSAIVALAGASGTLSEVGLGLKAQKPVIGLAAWAHIPGVTPAQTAEEAVRLALS